MKEKIVGIGVLLSALLASACCLGPIMLVALGSLGTALASGLIKYRPFFLALTAILLATAFYLTYKKRKVACSDGSCKTLSGSKTAKFSLWIIAAFAIMAAAFPYWSVLLLDKSSVGVSAGAETIILKVSGMTCTACALNIERSLKKVPGVQSASVDFDTTEAIVLVEPDQVQEETLISAVQGAGSYSAELKKQN